MITPKPITSSHVFTPVKVGSTKCKWCMLSEGAHAPQPQTTDQIKFSSAR